MKPKTAPTPALPQRLSLVAQTSHSLREGIRTGYWREYLPAERELCARLQISRRTLRAALEALQREGLLRVEGRARRIVSRRHSSAARAGRSRVVTVLAARSPRELHPTAMLLLDTLRDNLARAGFRIDFHANPSCFSARPARALAKVAHQNPGAVWVTFGSREPMQRWFMQRLLPLLVLGSCRPGIALPSIDVDFHATCRHAGDVLWRKGHRRFAVVLPRDAFDGDDESERGFREALRPHPEARLRVLRHNGSAAHLCSLLDAALRESAPPTGFFVAHPRDALTVLTHLLRRGKRVPQDAAVLARDDESYLAHTSPVLSRYATDPQHFARKVSAAVRTLAETYTLAPKAIRLMPAFIAGETV